MTITHILKLPSNTGLLKIGGILKGLVDPTVARSSVPSMQGHRAKFSPLCRRPRDWGLFSPLGAVQIHKRRAVPEKALCLNPTSQNSLTGSEACFPCLIK